jgi:hypothetical protein
VGQATPPPGFTGLLAITAGSEHSLAIQRAVAPRIIISPRDRTVTSGQGATFTVFATGSAPLSYQWFKDDDPLTGASHPVHTIASVKFSDAGVYQVKVANSAGTAIASAKLTLGTIFRVVSTNSSGGTVRIAIRLTSAGNENALGFSIGFNKDIIRFADAVLGADATGGFLNTNPNQAQTCKLGIALALPANATFAVGDREVLVVSFQVINVCITQTTEITLEDAPIARQVADPDANGLSGDFRNGTLSISAGIEADVDGDGKVTASDVTRIGRIAARLDISGLTSGLLQRADCAPMLTGGDGKITIHDWVQAARFAARLDPAKDATGPAPASLQSSGKPGDTSSGSVLSRKTFSQPELRVLNNMSSPRKATDIVIRLQAKGEENALGFTLNFNQRQLNFIEAKLGNVPGSPVFLVNTEELNSGKIGILLALPAGISFPAGAHDVARVSFQVSLSVAGVSRIEFSDAVVVEEISSVQGAKIPTTFAGGILSLTAEAISNVRLRPPTFLKPGKLQFQIDLRDGQSVIAGTLPRFQIWASSDLSSPTASWVKLNPESQPIPGAFIVDDPESVGRSRRFYKLVEGP